jgi:peroxiredoxin
MRPLVALALLTALAVLTGCGSSATPTGEREWSPPRKTEDEVKRGHLSFQDNPKQNPEVLKGPLPTKYLNAEGKEVDLESFRGKSNVVLVIVKGMPTRFNNVFCPGCLAQVNALTANHKEFQERNAEVIMLFPGPTDKLPQFLTDAYVDGRDGRSKPPFPLVLDPELKTIDSLGIREDLARPSTFILDKSGNPVFAYVGRDTNERPSVRALLAQLDKLNAKN